MKPILQYIQGQSKLQSNVVYNGPLHMLQAYDLPYIYHHLSDGVRLRLQREEDQSGNTHIAVYYKSFKLGLLPKSYTATIEHMLKRGYFLSSRISRVIRQKYLPTEFLEITISEKIEA
jgi:hypothetical protein